MPQAKRKKNKRRHTLLDSFATHVAGDADAAGGAANLINLIQEHNAPLGNKEGQYFERVNISERPIFEKGQYSIS